MLTRIFAPKKRQRQSDVSLFLLQRRLERFSTTRLDSAIQQAWKKEYDPKELFSVAIPQELGAIIHAFGVEISIRHFEYALDWKRLGEEQPPFWATHAGFTALDYQCEQEPDNSSRQKMYRGLAMLAAELASGDTAGFFFPLEQVLLPNSIAVNEVFRVRGPLNPFDLELLTDD